MSVQPERQGGWGGAWEGDGFPEAVTVGFCGKLCPPWQNSGIRSSGERIFLRKRLTSLRHASGVMLGRWAPSSPPSPLGLSLAPTCLPLECLLHLSLLPFKPHAWLFLQLTRANQNQILNDPQPPKTLPLKPTHSGGRMWPK